MKVFPKAGDRVAIYARCALAEQRAANPLSSQIELCQAVAARNGWLVAGVYVDAGHGVGTYKDEAKSGRYVRNRTGYLEMMAAAVAGEADVICVFSLDRLGRNSRELHDAKNRLSDVDASIFTHDHGVMSGVHFALMAEYAQMESEKIADRTGRGKLAAAARGKKMGAIPYGYLLETLEPPPGASAAARRQRQTQIKVDPVTSKIVLRAHLDFDAGNHPQTCLI